ncbi:MAG: FAD-dependent oxidoreductase [Pseudomonadota bacterium]
MADTVVDVAIVGAGPVGASLALGLADLGLKTVVIDGRSADSAPKNDGRNFAIVTGSWRLLDTLGIAGKLTGNSQPLHGLEAIDGGGHILPAPSVMFQDSDLDSPDPDDTLGQMVRAEDLQRALDDALALEENLTVLRPCRFKGVETDNGYSTLYLDGADTIRTRLLIGADGMNSPVRKALGISVEGRDYGKSVFTANVKLDRPHQGIARQLFLPEGPFATLPLTSDRANLAWYLKRGAAEALADCTQAEIEAELNAKFAAFSSPMTLDSPAGSYPLILQVATQIIAPRAALVGDAARRVNPLAGQGLNQGFRDAAAMIDVLKEAQAVGLDIGSPSVLEGFSEARRFEGTAAALALDGIDRLFSNDLALTKPIRSLGLLAANEIGPLRRWLARKASATDDGVPASMEAW